MSLAACAGLVQRGDPDRFLATMAAPVDLRGPLFALYAFNLEVARAPWAATEPLIAEMRLQWWRDVLEEIGQGAAPRAHEVVRPLATAAARHDLPLDVLDRLVAARRWDIGKDAFEDAAAFAAYLDDTSGGLLWAAVHVTGVPGNEAAVRHVGRAQGLANWMVAVPGLEARGRIPLIDGRPGAIRDLARAALDDLATARRRLGRGPLTPVLRAAWQAGPILQQVVRDPGSVSRGTLGLSEFSRRARLMWRAARGGW